MDQNCWQGCNRAAARDAEKETIGARANFSRANRTPTPGVHITNVHREVIMVNQSPEHSIFNGSHVRDYEYSVQVNHWFLKPIGAWPKISESSKIERLFAKLLNFTCHSLIIFTFVPCVMYIFLEDATVEARMRAIGPMSHWLIGELNYCCLLMGSDDIAHCAKHVQRDWQTVRKASDREIMLRNAKVGRFIACVSALCMHLGVFSYFVFNSFRKIAFRAGNDSYLMYQLPCPVYTKLMDVRFSPANEIVFGLQFLSGFVVNSITVGACGMAAFLAMHACGQLNVVTTKLDKLVNTDTGLEEEKIAQRKLGLIVEHHLRTLSFVWYIEKVMHLICLVELVGCTLNMCMLEYYILTEKSKQTIVSYSILYAAMTFNIFIFCYIGEILTEECKKVGERVYLTEWHRLHYKTMRGLIMIISRSNMVIKITAGKLMQMSIATLGDKKSAQALCSIVHRVRGNLDSVEFLRRCGTLAMTIQSIYVSSDLDNHSDYSLQLNRLFLKPIGAWPASPSTTTFDRILSIVLNIICYSSILLAFAPCFLNMLLEDESFYMKLKSLGPVSHWFVSSVNYTTLLLRGKDIRYCVEHMEADWRTVTRKKDQEVMLKNAKLGRYVATFCAAFMQGGVLCFCFVTAFSTQVIRVGNETRIVHVLPCAVYKKLVNVDESPTNEIVLFIQIWAAFVANCSTVGIFSLAAVLAAHACGQLSVVMTWIEEFVYEGRNRNGEAALKEFGAIVERHLKALNFISCIEEVMNRICLLELLRCTMDVCVIGYYVLAEWDDHDVQNLTTYFMMLFSICFNIFILCYIGEILTEQSKKVGEVVYMTNWYYLPEKRILDLILIIVRSSVVVKITAGKIVHMSIYTFSDVIKTGCTYLNLLREMSR